MFSNLLLFVSHFHEYWTNRSKLREGIIGTMSADAAAIARLVEMGFPAQRCEYALNKTRGDEGAAVEHMLTTTDDPIMVDSSVFDVDPAPTNASNSRSNIGSAYWPAADKPLTPPTSPYAHAIDLTNSPAHTPLLLENGPFDPLTAGKSFLSADELEMQKAVEMSLLSSGSDAFGTAGGATGNSHGKSTEDSAVQDAIARSLHDAVRSVGHSEVYSATPSYISNVEGLLEPANRVRSVNA